MAPLVPEEVDVFTIPHSRMKGLVSDYYDKLKSTNFSNDVDLDTLLHSLLKTFMEFKTHEQIENRFIMKKLKNKLKRLSIQNTAVCNCHKDDQLGQMMRLIKDGYNKKTEQDRWNYGLRLKQELEEFTQTFLPHMQEEEEVFQPLLLKYFTYDELCRLKQKVIQQHVIQEQVRAAGLLEKHVTDELTQLSSSSEEETEKVSTEPETSTTATPQEVESEPPISSLPDELLHEVLRYLSPRDLCRAAGVDRRWNAAAYDPRLWRAVLPVQWARGEWSFEDSCVRIEEEEEEAGDEYAEQEAAQYSVIDDDADIDESEMPEDEGGSDNDVIAQMQREGRILHGLARYVLPRVGSGVRSLCLHTCRALTNNTLARLLRHAPRLESLHLHHTRVTDAGLKPLGKRGVGGSLREVVLSGCVGIGDATLMRLGMAINVRGGGREEEEEVKSMRRNLGCGREEEEGEVSKKCQGNEGSQGCCSQGGNAEEMKKCQGSQGCCSKEGDAEEAVMIKKKNLSCSGEEEEVETTKKCQGNPGSQGCCRKEADETEAVMIKKKNQGCCRSESMKNQSEQVQECCQTELNEPCCQRDPDQSCSQSNPSQSCSQRDPSQSCSQRDPDQACSQRDPDQSCSQTNPSQSCSQHSQDTVRYRSRGLDKNRRDEEECLCQEYFELCNVTLSSPDHANHCQLQESWNNRKCSSYREAKDSAKDRPVEEEKDGQSEKSLMMRKSEKAGGICDKNTRTKTGEAKNIPCQSSHHHNSVIKTSADEDEEEEEEDRSGCHAGCRGLKAWGSIEDCAGTAKQEEKGKTVLRQNTTLEYLDLSGCYQITDMGLRSLYVHGAVHLSALRHLDTSGCMRVTGAGLGALAAHCPRLEPPDLYYCDNVCDGPYPDGASACRNAGPNSRRVCCRTGFVVV